MTPEAMRTHSANQIIGRFLDDISHLSVDRQLDAIASMARQTVDSELRRPLLREFNNLAEREANATAPAKQPDEEAA